MRLKPFHKCTHGASSSEFLSLFPQHTGNVVSITEPQALKPSPGVWGKTHREAVTPPDKTRSSNSQAVSSQSRHLRTCQLCRLGLNFLHVPLPFSRTVSHTEVRTHLPTTAKTREQLLYRCALSLVKPLLGMLSYIFTRSTPPTMPIVLPYSLGGVVLQSSGLDCHGPVNMTGENT